MCIPEGLDKVVLLCMCCEDSFSPGYTTESLRERSNLTRRKAFVLVVFVELDHVRERPHLALPKLTEEPREADVFKFPNLYSQQIACFLVFGL